MRWGIELVKLGSTLHKLVIPLARRPAIRSGGLGMRRSLVDDAGNRRNGVKPPDAYPPAVNLPRGYLPHRWCGSGCPINAWSMTVPQTSAWQG